jgi:hypothetical protein
MHSQVIPIRPERQLSSRYTVDPQIVDVVRRYREAQAQLALCRLADPVRPAHWRENGGRRCG